MSEEVLTYRLRLRRVGVVLCVVGAIDIAAMIYAISHAQSYSSSFNIFALIAGIFLIRGSLRAVRIVRLFAGFMAMGFWAIPIGLLVAVPHDLIATYLRITPTSSICLFVGFFAILQVLLWWVYACLVAPDVEAAVQAQTPKSRFSFRHSGLVVGCLFMCLLLSITIFTLHSETAHEAVSRARDQVGNGYRFYMSGYSRVSTSNRTEVLANVVAYTDTTVQTLEIKWQE